MPKGHGAAEHFEVYLEFTETGERLNEFALQHIAGDDGIPRTNVWMECEPSARFRIVIRDMRLSRGADTTPVLVVTYLDGRLCDRVVSSGTGDWIIDLMTRENKDTMTHHPLMFAPLATVEDHGAADMTLAQASVVGTIKLELDYGSSTGLLHGQVHVPPVIAELGTMWEKDATKMGTMTRAAPETKVAPRHSLMQFTSNNKGPFYVFHISYALRVALKRRFPDLFSPEPGAVIDRDLPPYPIAPQTSKRARAHSSALVRRSRSSSSSSSGASVELLEGTSSGTMEVVPNAFNAALKSAAKKAEAGKGVKDERKKATKHKTREAKPKVRGGESAASAIDLSIDSEDEPGYQGSLPALRAAAKESDSTLKVKKEVFAKRG